MRDVASLAGVATSTVSLYLRKPEAVMQRTRRRIATAIEQLGYVPNMMAGGLASASTRAVSLIVPSLRNAFFAETADAMQTVLAGEGVQLLLGHTEYNLAREEALVRASLAWRPSAIVLTGLDHSRSTRQMLMRHDTTVIEIWELGGSPIDMMVGFDHREVGRAAARHLLERGCRHPAFLGARLDQDQRARQRAEGFLSAIAYHGGVRPQILTVPDPASPEAGTRLLAEAMATHPTIDGVACSNDLIALGVMFACARRDIRIPGQIKVIGFGDLPFAPVAVPPLTTIRPHGRHIGEQAAHLALSRLGSGDRSMEPRCIDVGFEVIHRETS